jgi:hypothetical protein
LPVANGAFQGQLGAQNHLVHLGAPANARIMRLQTSTGFTGFHSLKDSLNEYAVKSIIMMNMTNGNVGFKRDTPAHPIHMASGAHVTAGGVWTNASSRELKQDIEPITTEQARETVRALQPVGYRYKEEQDEQYVGFIAEDVPELVATKDRKSLAPMDVVAVLTKVVQDQEQRLSEERQRNDKQQALIESLTKRLAALEAKP